MQWQRTSCHWLNVFGRPVLFNVPTIDAQTLLRRGLRSSGTQICPDLYLSQSTKCLWPPASCRWLNVFGQPVLFNVPTIDAQTLLRSGLRSSGTHICPDLYS